MHFSNIVAALAMAGAAVARPATMKRATNSTNSLFTAMVAQGRTWVGTALTIRNNANETAIIQQNFNSITPENAMKWDATEPSRNTFTLSNADSYVAFAAANKLQIHCHTLVWHSQLPSWVSSGGFDNATLISIMENHIKGVAGKYNGSCTRWDVVNEALNEDGTYRTSVWYNTIGEAYIPIAFRLAAKYDTQAKLFYNDYNLEYNGAKAQGARRIVSLIKSYGLRIDGVGYQGHVASETTKTSGGAAPGLSTLTASLNQTAALGVDVAYTEIDVRFNTPATADKLAVQAATWQRIAQSCLAVKRCVGMTVWGISDKYSWIPSTFSGEGGALLWDDNYVAKPAYTGFLSGINGS